MSAIVVTFAIYVWIKNTFKKLKIQFGNNENSN